MRIKTRAFFFLIHLSFLFFLIYSYVRTVRTLSFLVFWHVRFLRLLAPVG